MKLTVKNSILYHRRTLLISFCLCNELATFQLLMDLVLFGLQWFRCLVYLDHIIVLGRTFIQNLQMVLQCLQESGLKLKPSKCCCFFQCQVHYLGYIILKDGVAPDPSKVEKVAPWPQPKSTKDLQQFMRIANYYHRFIQNCTYCQTALLTN